MSRQQYLVDFKTGAHRRDAMSRPSRAAAALLVLAACHPLVYTPGGDGMSHGTEPGDDAGDTNSTTDFQPTGPSPGPGPGDPFPDKSCFDGLRTDGETDVDCGGPCPACGAGLKCEQPDDCQSGACSFGVCVGLCSSDDDCHDLDEAPCIRGACQQDGTCTPTPANDGAPCDDGDPCTLASACAMGLCLGEPQTCDALAGPCRKPFCNPQTGNCAVEFADPGSACDDGLDCSLFDACDGAGECAGKPTQPTFFEDFAMPQAWQLDPLWQISPAIPTMCSLPGSEDPPLDHGGDGSLAGLLVGACTPFEPFPPNCLTSPFLELMPGPQPSELRYWSQLSTPGAPIKTTIDLFDGQVWTQLTDFDGPIVEKQWTEHVFMLPMQPIFQVRFCQMQMDANMTTAGGWSLDDISIGPPVCAP